MPLSPSTVFNLGYNECRIILLVLSAALASYNGHLKTYCMSYVGYQSDSEFIIK